MERGRIATSYTVICSCGESEYADHDKPANNHREASVQARKLGWANTRARGWLCPKCQTEEKRKKAQERAK